MMFKYFVNLCSHFLVFIVYGFHMIGINIFLLKEPKLIPIRLLENLMWVIETIGILSYTIVVNPAKIYYEIKANKYFYFLATIGFSFYSLIFFLRVLRTRVEGPVIPEHISELVIGCYSLISLGFFVISLMVVYKFCTLWGQPANIPLRSMRSNLKFIQWILTKLVLFAEFYNKVLYASFSVIWKQIPGMPSFIQYITKPINTFLSAHDNVFALFYIRYGIPLFIAICFMLDICLGEYYYFLSAAILFILPLMLRIFIYMVKTAAEIEAPVWYCHFNIEVKGLNVTHFSVKEEFKYFHVSNEWLKEDTFENIFNIYLQHCYDFFRVYIHEIHYRCAIKWELIYNQQLYKKELLVSQFFTFLLFFLGWSYLTILVTQIFLLEHF